ATFNPGTSISSNWYPLPSLGFTGVDFSILEGTLHAWVYDYSYAMVGGSKTPMNNGLIAILTYPDNAPMAWDTSYYGTGWAFADYAGNILINPPFGKDLNFADGNITWSAVPIPPTLILLGSGLLGVIGLRRKFHF
ncbi:MAG: hypothetical protein NC821_06035, partial [Candidatus Omnitrophica bacterium]|nr:hypothetical protein [Candidatus Omnitrophota bacterium]